MGAKPGVRVHPSDRRPRNVGVSLLPTSGFFWLPLVAVLVILPAPALALNFTVFTDPHPTVSGGTIGFAYAGNKFVGSVYHGGTNALYSTNLSGGNVAVFAPSLSLSDGGEHFVSSSLGLGGFPNRDIYVADGNAIRHITNDGSHDDVFVAGLSSGVRGIVFDAVGTFGNNMLVTTSNGDVYRISSSGVPTLLASIGRDTEGLDVAPIGGGFGSFDGQLIVTSEGTGELRAIGPSGAVTLLPVYIPGGPEELSFVPRDLGASGDPVEGFYGSNYTENVIKAATAEFQGFQGDVVVTSELSGAFTRVHWNGQGFETTQIGQFPAQPEDGIFVTSAILNPGHCSQGPPCASLVDFESLPTGVLLRNQLENVGIRVDGAGSLSGLIMAEGQSNSLNFGNSPTKFMHVGERGEPTTIRFVDPSSPNRAIGATFVSFLLGDGDALSETFLVSFLDTAGAGFGAPETLTTIQAGVRITATSSELGAGIGGVRITLAPWSASGGGLDDLSYSLTTCPMDCTHQVPTIISLPLLNAESGVGYEYDVRAIEPGSHTLRYFLLEGPAGRSIDAVSGAARWTPVDAQAGNQLVRLEARDEAGAAAGQHYYVTVRRPGEDTTPPHVTLQFVVGSQALLGPEVAVTIGTSVEFRVDATDNTGVTNKSLRLGSTLIPLDPSGRATQTMTTLGLFDVLAVARDAAGNADSSLRRLRVYDPNDPHFPTVTIHAPANDSLLSKPANVVVTVADSVLESYTVDYAPLAKVDLDHLEAPNSAWVNIATGTTPIVSKIVGVFDPTILLNDDYVIRAIGTNVNGKIQTRGIIVHVFSQLKLGEFRLEFTDLAIPVAGIPIEVKRIYDSRQSGDSLDFGFGWSLGIQDAHIFETLRTSTLGYRTLYPGSRIYINTPDGRRVGFTAYNISVNCFGFCFATIGLRPDPGVYEKLELADGNVAVIYDGYYLDGLASGPFDPENYRLTLKDGTVYEYSQTAGLKKVTDLNGNRLEFTPGGIVHYLAGQSTPDQQVPFVRDAHGRITSVVDPNGHALTYNYDAVGDLRTFRDQVGNLSQYAYHPARPHYLATIIDPLGHQAVRTEFDDAGRIKSVTDALGNKVSQDFNLATNTGTFTDARGNVTVSTYDDQGNVVKKVDPEGGVTEFQFDANNNEIWRKDPRGFITQKTYDANGNITQTTDPLLNVTTVAYNALSKPTSVTDALHHTTGFAYDSQGGLTSVQNALGGTSMFVRDAAGRLTRATDFNGHTTTYDYTGGCSCGKPGRVANPDGTFRTYEYNSFGQVTREVDENGNETVSIYDDAGRLKAVRNAEGDTTHYGYSAALKTSETDPLRRTMLYGYDADNRQLSITDALGGVVRFHYDAAGNRDSVVDPVGNVTRFVYDGNNRLIEEVDPLGHSSTFAYDVAGNPIQAIDRNHRKRTFEFDALNRRTKEYWWDGGAVVRTLSYSFNSLGAMTAASDPASTLTFTFDALNRMTKAAQTAVPGLRDFTLTYDYDAESNVTSTTDGDGVEVLSTYEARNRLSRRVWQGGGLPGASVRFFYDGVGNPTGIQRYADPATTDQVGQSTYSYDRVNGVTSILHADGGRATLAKYQYSRDAAEEITQRVLDSQTVDYGYDRAGQLTSAVYSDGRPRESYTYDSAGNRMGHAYSSGPGNELVTDGTYNYSYDAEGALVGRTNIATNATTTYSYDYRGRLTGVARRDGTGSATQVAAFTYDALDRRVLIAAGATTTHTLWNASDLWADTDSAGVAIQRYLMADGVDHPLAQHRQGVGVWWYLPDNIWSIRDMVDGTGRLTRHFEYDAFGTPLSTSGTLGDRQLLFVGREWEAVGESYFCRARYYIPATGRFTEKDPNGVFGGDMNLYRYVGNAPVDRRDPGGRLFVDYGTLLKNVTTGIVTGLVVGGVSGAAKVAYCGGDVEEFAKITLAGGLGGAVLGVFGAAPVLAFDDATVIVLASAASLVPIAVCVEKVTNEEDNLYKVMTANGWYRGTRAEFELIWYRVLKYVLKLIAK